jgi:broad specificity phosphatase PhoE
MGINISRPQSESQREAQILALRAEEKRAANAAITSMDKKEFKREKEKQEIAAREIKSLSQAEIPGSAPPVPGEEQWTMQQERERDVGQTNFYVKTDNNFKFSLDKKVHHEDEFRFREAENALTAMVPITMFNFYFVRHAASCANEKSKKLDKVELDDPFISNDGIRATTYIKDEYDTFFKKIMDHYFCSVLIRTWCTAWMLFTKHISKFQIAPHLREDKPGYTNHPYPYGTNVNRFAFFKEYVKTLKGLPDADDDGQPGYALMNKAFASYGSEFVDKNGIAEFMQWYITNENALGRNNKATRNVVVVCHSDIIMTFCEAHLTKSELIDRGMDGGEEGFFKKKNNYCVRIQVRMPVKELKPILQTRAQAPRVVGGNKSKKRRNMSTKLNKHKFKKTRIRKTHGGSLGIALKKMLFGQQNQYVFSESESGANGSYVTNLPFPITIKTVIQGTKHIRRYQDNQSLAPPPDCICYPDAYKEKEKTLDCAKKYGKDDLKNYKERYSLPLEPVSPQPVSPQPVSPQPASPQPASAQPVSPQPASAQHLENDGSMWM